MPDAPSPGSVGVRQAAREARLNQASRPHATTLSRRAARASRLSRVLALVLLAWALAMVVPSFYRVVRPLAAFGFSADNDGRIVDLVDPFASTRDSPAAAAGLAAGDRVDLRRMTCRAPRSRVCADLIMVLGGSGGLQYVLPGRQITLDILPADGGPARSVRLRARPAPLRLPDRLVLLANTLASIIIVLAAFRLVWPRADAPTWGFFLYAIWINPGQVYAYYALLQPIPLAVLIQQAVGALVAGAAYGGLLLFALRFPGDAPDPRWRGWERAVPAVGIVLTVLALLMGANLFGWRTETIAAFRYGTEYAIDGLVLVVLLLRRRGLHPRDAQRMRWVIAGCALGLPAYISAWICESTGLVQSAFGRAPSQTVVGLLFLMQGVLAYFVWNAVRRPRVVSVAIPLRHGTITAVLTMVLAVPVMFLHERLAEYQGLLHVPEWIWPLVIAPVVLVALQRLHEIAVDLADHAFNPAYHRARRGLAQAGREVLAADGFAAIDRCLVEAPAHALRLASVAVFRDTDGTFRRVEPAVGWPDGTLAALHPQFDGPIIASARDGRPRRLAPGEWRRAGAPAEDAAPCLAVPVRGGIQRAIAVVLFGPHTTGSDITPDECELLRGLAEQAAFAYERVEAAMLRREVRALRAQLQALAAPAP